jgi:hypothetical protein
MSRTEREDLPPEATYQELAELAGTLADRFLQRRDLYPRQLAAGQYVTVHEPLPEALLIAHLEGTETLGAYLLDAESRARFMVLDADDEPDRRRLLALSQVLAKLGCPSYVEASRRGGHLWFFFETPRPGKEVRWFGKGLQAYFNLASIELYPKQDALRSGPGSLIRLPFGVHRKSGRRYGFYTSDGQPLAPTLREQIMVLRDPETVPERLFEHYASYAAAPRPQPVFEAVEVEGEQLSDRIKAAVGCGEFISRYVELDRNGRGLCPFHDDRVASFNVNAEENYWHCFAGCGGGSIIDFWMVYQRRVEGKPGDFKTAIRELSKMLLK